MIITFPIKTVSELNTRESWASRYRRKKQQQHDFTYQWKAEKVKVELPATIIFTRYSCQRMDSDNLAGSFKNCRDSLAKEIGVDDGSELLTFVYRQERIGKRIHFFTLEIEENV